MRLEIIGVGEAFDPERGNASVLIDSDTKLLVDCGYGVPARYFARRFAPDFLDAIYITHFHADHFFGVPALLGRASEESRRKPLTIIGQPGTEFVITKIIDAAYPGLRGRLTFPLLFKEAADALEHAELHLRFAETRHAVRNFAVRIEAQGCRVAVSGDGEITPVSTQLFSDCQVVVHEAFCAQRQMANHSTAREIAAMVRAFSTSPRLILVHLQRTEREENLHSFWEELAGLRAVIPEPGEIFELS